MEPVRTDSAEPERAPGVRVSGAADVGLDGLLAAFQFLQGQNLQLASRLAATLGIGATDLRVLLIVNSRPGISPRTLATRLDLTTGSVTALVDRQEQADRLERRAHPTDRRSQTLYLTERGREAVFEVRRTYAVAFDGVFSPDELLSATVSLQSLGTALAQHLEATS